MNFRVDMRGWRKDADKFKNGLSAIGITLVKSGRGEIIVSKRTQRDDERSAPVHGKGIANMLAKKGGDVFRVDKHVERTAFRDLEHGWRRISLHAMRTGVPQQRHLRMLLRDVTQDVTREVVEGLVQGRGNRKKSSKYAAKLRSMAERGATFIDTTYGNPPPWGVKTGRFVEGIKARVSKSKRALRSVYDTSI